MKTREDILTIPITVNFKNQKLIGQAMFFDKNISNNFSNPEALKNMDLRTAWTLEDDEIKLVEISLMEKK